MKEGRRPRVFAQDEMNLRAVNSLWRPEDLLGEEGVFFLKDVVKILDLDPTKIKRKAKELVANGQSTWDIMGARKIWNHWILRMTVFAPYYRKNLISRVQAIPKNMNGNILLEQKGVFFLTDVSKHIPFSTHQLRYQAKRNPRSKEEFGIWKDEELNAFVVDMERFGPWIRSLWEKK